MWNEPMPKWRKARKQHQCQGDGCGKVIAPGDRYLDRSLRDPDNTHLRYCEQCGGPVVASVESYHFFSRTDFPDRYQERISSTGWKNLRAELIELRGNRCERCREEQTSLTLHHLHYRSLGNERPEDVELLCFECHAGADAAREAKRWRKYEPIREGWIVGDDGDYWGKLDPDVTYVPLPGNRYAPVDLKSLRK